MMEDAAGQGEQTGSSALLTVDGRGEPPTWALLQRALFERLDRAAVEFVQRYTRPDSTLLWRASWPGMDGSDDPYEGFHGLALLYALGGDERLLGLARTLWDAITWQWTEYGQIYREFDGYYDWMHHGEGYQYLYFLALADPTSLKDRQRALRFARFYSGADPTAPNYDPMRRMMRAPISGSRGPRFHLTAEDWSTHREILDHYPSPFEDLPGVPGDASSWQWSDDRVYAAILERMNRRMARGDVPLNLTATSMVTHAYLYSGDDRYRSWVLDYLDAWIERTHRNGGIMPDNTGPGGVAGELMDGKWWGGYYGWRWPHGAFTILEPALIAGCNAVLLTGDTGQLDLVRSQLDLLWALRQERDDAPLVPHKHRDAGWTDYRPMDPIHPIALWALSYSKADRARVTRLGQRGDWGAATTQLGKGAIGNAGPWFAYMQGDNPAYPEQIMRATLAVVEARLAAMRADDDPALWDIHRWQDMTPLILEGVVQLTLGAPMPIYHGGLLHVPVRYYDGARRRAGLPPDVAALVDAVDGDSVTLSLVNTACEEGRAVVVQAGTFGEHRFRDAVCLDVEPTRRAPVPINGPWLQVRLGAGARVRLHVTMDRYARPPSYETPWSSREQWPAPLEGRHSP